MLKRTQEARSTNSHYKRPRRFFQTCLVNRDLFQLLAILVIFGCLSLSSRAADPSDPVLDLLLKKGIVTQEEVDKAKADAERIRTNELANLNLMPPAESKWKINNAIKNVEL